LSTELHVPWVRIEEAVSALQRAIRRGEEEQAVVWAAEMDRSGNVEYCWKRLKVVLSEDVGLAEPQLPTVVRVLYETLPDLKKAEAKTGDTIER
jgi:replication-associated recombination protein RarA